MVGGIADPASAVLGGGGMAVPVSAVPLIRGTATAVTAEADRNLRRAIWAEPAPS